MPLHPLIVHAVVVLGPLGALTGLVYAFVPKWRWLLRWPLVVLAVVTAARGRPRRRPRARACWRRGPSSRRSSADHEEAGELLRNVSLAFVLVAAFGAWALGGASALASGRGARETRLAIPAMALLTVGAVALLVTLFLAGDSGAKAVWG